MILLLYSFNGYSNASGDAVQEKRIDLVASAEGLIAFWEFSQEKEKGWASHFDSQTIDQAFNLQLGRIGDEKRYTAKNWPYTDAPSQLRFDTGGPFGKAIRFNKGYLYGVVDREEFDETLLDIHGNAPFTLIAWIKFVGRRHMVAGIWDEGGWNKYGGRRQIALFGGLFGQKGVIAHISTTGASSYPQSTVPGSQYARMRAIDGQSFEDDQWVSMAMTFDPDKGEVVAYLDGEMTPLLLTDPVVQSVLKLEQEQEANPYAFDMPIFSPRSFGIKYNGYLNDGRGVYEHRLQVDLKQGVLIYFREEREGSESNPYRISFDVKRKDRSLLSEPLIFLASPGTETALPATLDVEYGDVIWTELEVFDNGVWNRVGSVVQREVRKGAPFTFGRALGLGAEERDHGSTIFIDGVAVFNRVLGREELVQLSFKNEKELVEK